MKAVLILVLLCLCGSALALNLNNLRSNLNAKARDSFYASAATEGLFVDNLHTVSPKHNFYDKAVRYTDERISSYDPVFVDMTGSDVNFDTRTSSAAKKWEVKQSSAFSCGAEISGPIDPAGVVTLTAFAKLSTEVVETEAGVEVTYSAELGGKIKVGVKVFGVTLAISGKFASTCKFSKSEYSTNLEGAPMTATLFCIGTGIKFMIGDRTAELDSQYIDLNLKRLSEKFDAWLVKIKDAPAGKYTVAEKAYKKTDLQKVVVEYAQQSGYGFYHNLCSSAKNAIKATPAGEFATLVPLLKATTALTLAQKTTLYDQYVDVVESFFRKNFLGAAQQTAQADLACADVTNLTGEVTCMYFKAGMLLDNAQKAEHWWSADHGTKQNFRKMVIHTVNAAFPSAPTEAETPKNFRDRLYSRILEIGSNWKCDSTAAADLAAVKTHVTELSRSGHWLFNEALVKMISPDEYTDFMVKVKAMQDGNSLKSASFTLKFSISFSSEVSPRTKFNVDISPGNKKWSWLPGTTGTWGANVWKWTAGLTVKPVTAAIDAESSGVDIRDWKSLTFSVDYELPSGFTDSFFDEKWPLGLAQIELPLTAYAGSLMTLACSINEKGWTYDGFSDFGKALVNNALDSTPQILKYHIALAKAALEQDTVPANADWRASFPAKLLTMVTEAGAAQAIAAAASAVASAMGVDADLSNTLGFSITFAKPAKAGTGCANSLSVASVKFSRKKSASLKIGKGVSLKVSGGSGNSNTLENDGKF